MENLNKHPKQEEPGRYKIIWTWDKEHVSLVEKDREDLKESMKERARGVSVYEMIEKYGDPELIPGYGDPSNMTARPDGNLHNGADIDFTKVPEFSTDVTNAQLAQAEAALQKSLVEAEEAQKKAAEAKAKAEEAAKAKEAFIQQMMAEKGVNNG